jgi:hypothetical protein
MLALQEKREERSLQLVQVHPGKPTEMFRTGGLVTLLWPKGAWARDKENGDFRKGPVGC